jgi:uncharacterized protein (DUF4415 family)
MANEETITRITPDEAKKRIAARQSQTNWAKVDAMSEEDIEAAIASDPDESDIQWDWSKATVGLPSPKAMVNMRLDRDVLDWFREGGRGYQTRINAVLRSYMQSGKRPA